MLACMLLEWMGVHRVCMVSRQAGALAGVDGGRDGRVCTCVGWIDSTPRAPIVRSTDPTPPHNQSPSHQVSWEEGLQKTVEWYKQHTGRYGNIESALVPHPRAGGVTGAAPDIVL